MCGEYGDRAPLPASLRLLLKAPPLCLGAALTVLVPGQRGLKRSLRVGHRTVVLMLDVTFALETPPVRAGWAKVGVPVEVRITGNHVRRVTHGVLNVTSGHVELLPPEDWTAAIQQAFLRQVRQA